MQSIVDIEICKIHTDLNVNAASTLHLELFQMVAPPYVSGLLLRVIRIGVKACINVTLYAELFITSITEKYFLSPQRIILTAVE